MAYAKLVGLERLKARLAKIPQRMKVAVGSQLAAEVENLVEAMQRAAPVSDLEANPGELRDSLHFYPTPGRPLSYRILADARDAEGAFIGAHVEHGHKAPDGSHVAAVPFFFSTYRAHKKPIRRRLAAVARKAAKAAFEAR